MLNGNMISTKNDMCPLCNSGSVNFYSEFRERKYFRCSFCKLIFMDRENLLPAEIEKERYSHHEYDEDYDRYNLLIADKIIPFLSEGSTGIDYGCGQFNILAKTLTDKGFPTVGYDPFYEGYGDVLLLDSKYNFVVSIETAEHFHNPGRDFDIISNLLTDNGKVFIRTQIFNDTIEFNSWWYIKDDTHVSLYSEATIDYIRKKFGIKLYLV